jgi:hypothetical protein
MQLRQLASGLSSFLAILSCTAYAQSSAVTLTPALVEPGSPVLEPHRQIYPAHYRTSSLTVAPQFVTPGPDALKQIEADKQLKEKVFGASASEPLWEGRLSQRRLLPADRQLRHPPHLQRQAGQHS